jgi:hypothetical protein
MIFGSPVPLGMWAWAVWSHGKTEKGIEGNLHSAKLEAAKAIRRAREAAKNAL